MSKKVTEPCGCWYKDSGINRTTYRCPEHRPEEPTPKPIESLDTQLRELLVGYAERFIERDATNQLIALFEKMCNEVEFRVLLFARFESDWGDGSPHVVDERLKKLDPTYDKWYYIENYQALKTKLGESDEA
jgi:hypothetical protein